MEVRQYQKGDIKKIPTNPLDDFGMDEDLLTAQARTIVNSNGEPVACIGIVLLWPGVAQAWIKVDVEKCENSFALVKCARKLVKVAFKEYGLNRLHTPMRNDNLNYVRWVELIGFKIESVMYKAGQDGADLLMYAIVGK